MVFQVSRRLGPLLVCLNKEVHERLAENGCLQQHVWEGGVHSNAKSSSTLILLHYFSKWKCQDKHKQKGGQGADYSSCRLFQLKIISFQMCAIQNLPTDYTVILLLQIVVSCMCAYTHTAYNCLYMSHIYTPHIHTHNRLFFRHAFLCCKKSNTKYVTETSRRELFSSPVWNLSCTRRNAKVQEQECNVDMVAATPNSERGGMWRAKGVKGSLGVDHNLKD